MRFLRAELPVILLLSFGAFKTAAQEKKSSLPGGEGKEAVERVCANCHDLNTVVATRRTKIGWERMVEDMAARGAESSDEDMAAIVTYLTATFGKVNVNTASALELGKALNLPPTEAKAIVEYREKNGKISDFEQLKRVPGMNSETLQAKRPLIAFAL